MKSRFYIWFIFRCFVFILASILAVFLISYQTGNTLNLTVTLFLGYSIISLHRFGKSILNEYGGALPKIGLAFVGIKTFIWTSTFLPKQRDKIRYWLFAFVMFLFVVLILQNAISEYFWNEFE
jgi:hypothetical protein